MQIYLHVHTHVNVVELWLVVNIIACVMFFMMCTLPNDNAGHLESMLGDGTVTAWGIAPNRFAVQPDLLCLGSVKMVDSGFLKVVVFKAESAIAIFTNNTELQNGQLDREDGQAISLFAMQDMVKHLKKDQVPVFIQKMADDIFHCTLGAGSVLVLPPGLFMQ